LSPITSALQHGAAEEGPLAGLLHDADRRGGSSTPSSCTFVDEKSSTVPPAAAEVYRQAPRADS
jgi:hypothetical protein